jgi:hypothetical protein
VPVPVCSPNPCCRRHDQHLWSASRDRAGARGTPRGPRISPPELERDLEAVERAREGLIRAGLPEDREEDTHTGLRVPQSRIEDLVDLCGMHRDRALETLESRGWSWDPDCGLAIGTGSPRGGPRPEILTPLVGAIHELELDAARDRGNRLDDGYDRYRMERFGRFLIACGLPADRVAPELLESRLESAIAAK